MKKKKVKKFEHGAIIGIIFLSLFVMLLSLIFSIFGVEGYKTYIASGTLESSLVTVNNIFSFNGFKYLFNSSIANFQLFKPLVALIISLIGVSICENSGLLDALFTPLKRMKGSFLTFFVVLIGIATTFFGEYSYVILFPLVGVLYNKVGRNSILGIITLFLGVTLGYGTGIMFNYDTYMLGILTENAAKIDVDPNYAFSIVSTEYIMVVSTLIISIVLTKLIELKIVPSFKRKLVEEEKQSYRVKPTLIFALIMLIIIIYMVLPGLPFSGLFLDNNASRYIDKLFGNTSPFANGFICIFSAFLSICGIIFGLTNGKKDINLYSKGFQESFNGLGYLFILLFLISQLFGIIEWTNIGVVVGARAVDLISGLELSGIFLIIIFFILIIIMSLLIPSAMDKWILASPVVVPLFMRSNITPDFTQFIFQVADSVGKCITPIYIYFIMMLGFIQKYNYDSENTVSITKVYKSTFSTILLMCLLWILIISLWYISGLPIGIGGFSTL